MKHYERVCAYIDLDAILHNMDCMKKNIAKDTKIVAVIKTDGYGHGAVRIAKQLEDIPYVWGYAVATAEEALILRHAGMQKPILILGYTFPYSYEDMIREEIRPAVFREDQAKAFSEANEKTIEAYYEEKKLFDSSLEKIKNEASEIIVEITKKESDITLKKSTIENRELNIKRLTD